MIRPSALVRAALVAVVLSACSGETIPDVYGVKLGMTASDVRDRFRGAGGAFKADVAADDYAIRWTRGEAKTTASGEPNPLVVTFEYHMGTLVAIRARVPSDAPIAKGSSVVTSKSAVLARTPGEALDGGVAGTVEVDVLARDCPTHKTEAESLAARSR